MTRRAFTLIELLVVIAIIAILAAILFPVFAQAKKAAKQTQSLSNVKQVGTAHSIYLTDFDDVTVPLYWYDPSLSATSNQGFTYYPMLLLPYTKNRQMFLCPLDTNDDPLLHDSQGHSRFDPANQYHDYITGANPSYGYNYAYLNTYQPPFTYSGVSATALGSTAETITFAEATMKDLVVPGIGGTTVGAVTSSVGYSRIRPPFAVPAVGWAGWSGTYPNAKSQGQLWGRFDKDSVLASWLDGHAKRVAISKLKATGTTEAEVNRYWNGNGS
jgi:prepilin-type N-terminal cleavage/methylation domain-containing protein